MRNILSINQILDRTYDLYKKHIKSLLGFTTLMLMISVSIMYGIFIVIGIIFAIFSIVFAGIMASSQNILSGTFSGPFDSAIILIVFLYGGLAIIMVISYSFMNMVAAGPINAVEEVRKGNKVTFGGMFAYSFKKMLYVITSTIAFYITLTGITIIGIVIYALNFVFWLQDASLVTNIIIGVFIGIIVLIASIWFAVKGAYYLQVSLYEKKHFFGAINGSFKLVKGQFKRNFKMLFSKTLSFYVVYLSLGGLISIASNFLPMLITEKDGVGLMVGLIIFQMLMIFFQFAVSIVITPIQNITLPLIYFNERNRKYGDDLHSKIDILLHIQKSEMKEI